MSILRVYDPSECDERGVPLDWWHCRACNGEGIHIESGASCRRCDGHGSLKAAVLALMRRHGQSWRVEIAQRAEDRWSRPVPGPIRCEDCGHPMSDGTWEGDLRVAPRAGLRGGYLSFDRPDRATDEDWKPRHLEAALPWLRTGKEPQIHSSLGAPAVHYSACDTGCIHDGKHVRWNRDWDGPGIRQGWVEGEITVPIGENILTGRDLDGTYEVEASWRSVHVRPLGWAHDLRPEKLAVLCLRCWAQR